MAELTIANRHNGSSNAKRESTSNQLEYYQFYGQYGDEILSDGHPKAMDNLFEPIDSNTQVVSPAAGQFEAASTAFKRLVLSMENNFDLIIITVLACLCILMVIILFVIYYKYCLLTQEELSLTGRRSSEQPGNKVDSISNAGGTVNDRLKGQSRANISGIGGWWWCNNLLSRSCCCCCSYCLNCCGHSSLVGQDLATNQERRKSHYGRDIQANKFKLRLSSQTNLSRTSSGGANERTRLDGFEELQKTTSRYPQADGEPSQPQPQAQPPPLLPPTDHISDNTQAKEPTPLPHPIQPPDPPMLVIAADNNVMPPAATANILAANQLIDKGPLDQQPVSTSGMSAIKRVDIAARLKAYSRRLRPVSSRASMQASPSRTVLTIEGSAATGGGPQVLDESDHALLLKQHQQQQRLLQQQQQQQQQYDMNQQQQLTADNALTHSLVSTQSSQSAQSSQTTGSMRQPSSHSPYTIPQPAPVAPGELAHQIRSHFMPPINIVGSAIGGSGTHRAESPPGKHLQPTGGGGGGGVIKSTFGMASPQITSRLPGSRMAHDPNSVILSEIIRETKAQKQLSPGDLKKTARLTIVDKDSPAYQQERQRALNVAKTGGAALEAALADKGRQKLAQQQQHQQKGAKGSGAPNQTLPDRRNRPGSTMIGFHTARSGFHPDLGPS